MKRISNRKQRKLYNRMHHRFQWQNKVFGYRTDQAQWHYEWSRKMLGY